MHWQAGRQAWEGPEFLMRSPRLRAGTSCNIQTPLKLSNSLLMELVGPHRNYAQSLGAPAWGRRRRKAEREHVKRTQNLGRGVIFPNFGFCAMLHHQSQKPFFPHDRRGAAGLFLGARPYSLHSHKLPLSLALSFSLRFSKPPLAEEVRHPSCKAKKYISSPCEVRIQSQIPASRNDQLSTHPLAVKSRSGMPRGNINTFAQMTSIK